MVKSKYVCAQVELYTIAKLGWQSCKANLPKFTQLKAKYTNQYIIDRNNEITAAANMPDDKARSEQSISFRIKLEEQGDKCLGMWNRLKLYIADAFTEEFQKVKLEAAGSEYYAKAAQHNWDFLKGLLVSGSNFIELHSTELKANLNMPANFEASFNAAKVTFETLHQDFLKSEENSPLLTQSKIEANNALYDKLMGMFNDAQEVLKGNEVLLKQFVFTEILHLISGAGTAGIRGTVLLNDGFTVLAGVKVAIPTKNKSVLTDEEGKYEFPLASGVYTVHFSLDGHQLVVVEDFEVKIGVMSKLDCTMEAG